VEALANTYWNDRSWAAEPLFYRAPAPPGSIPREYQYAAVEFCLSRTHSLIGDAPGLGKTAEAILLSNATDARRSLVVCPASLRLNWEREIWRWSTIPNVRTYPTLSAKDGVSPEAHYEIISYDLLRNQSILDALLALRWDHLILDEAHYLKDPKGNKRTRAICAPDALPSVCGRITMLSGTIMPNQPIECYNAARLLDWDSIDRMSLEAFRGYYYEEGSGFVTGPYMSHDDYGNPVKKYGPHWSEHVRNVPRRLDELRARLRGSIMIRRLKEHVLTELPPKQWHVFPLSSNARIRKALKHPGWAKAEKLFEMDPDTFNTNAPIDGQVSTARRELGEAKAPEVAAYIHELFREGLTKIIVGAWHHTVLDFLRRELCEHGVVYMDGSTTPRSKQSAVDMFQNDTEIGIILGQTRPLSMGWNLSAAQDVVLAEFDWVPGNNDQLLDRPHRPGQVGDYVLGHVPIIPDTMDERIFGRAIEKDIAINEALDGT
jgi:SWI/SNF-related matrix-associated actin-dependent regulator 1 of chromatin subfamily A